MATLKKVSEVVAILGDKGFCEPHVVQKKGNGGMMQDYVEWHEVVRMLDEAFGPFGWDAVPTTSHTDYANGVYIYDGYIVGRAINDEDGSWVELKRAGRGVGLVPESARGSLSEHDRQSHGAKSDFYSNATKALGEGFGLYLYGRKANVNGNSAPTRPNTQATDTRAPVAPPTGERRINDKRPSEKQVGVLLKAGYPQSQIDGMDFATWKGCIDSIFGKGEAPVAPQKATPTAKPAAKAAKPEPVEDIDLSDDALPF